MNFLWHYVSICYGIFLFVGYIQMPELNPADQAFRELLTTEYAFVQDLTLFAASASMLQESMQQRKGKTPKLSKKAKKTKTELYNDLVRTLKGIKDPSDKKEFLQALSEYTDQIYVFLEAHPFYPARSVNSITIEEAMSFAEKSSESEQEFVRLCYEGTKVADFNKRIKFSGTLGSEVMKATQRGMRYIMLAEALQKHALTMHDRDNNKLKYITLADVITKGIGTAGRRVDKLLNEEDSAKQPKSNVATSSFWARLIAFFSRMLGTSKKKESIPSTNTSITAATDIPDTNSEVGNSSQVSPRSSNLSITSDSTENRTVVNSAGSQDATNKDTPSATKPMFVLRPRNGPLSKEDFIKKPKRARPREPGDPINPTQAKKLKETDREQKLPGTQAQDSPKPKNPSIE